jgi:hypothetical protein
VWCGLGSPGSAKGSMDGPYEHGNEPLGSMKCLEIVE